MNTNKFPEKWFLYSEKFSDMELNIICSWLNENIGMESKYYHKQCRDKRCLYFPNIFSERGFKNGCHFYDRRISSNNHYIQITFEEFYNHYFESNINKMLFPIF